MENILKFSIWGNSVKDYLVFIGFILVLIAGLNFLKYFLLRKLKKTVQNTKNKIDDMVLRIVEKYALPFIYFLVIYFSFNLISIQPFARKIIDMAIIVITTFFALRLLVVFVTHLLRYYWTKGGEDELNAGSLKGLNSFINIIIWSLGFIFLLDNLGFQISAVIAGLGIGGIAIGLAAQAVLGDMFSYFVIFFDKPFKVGDFIFVDNVAGTVDRIGIKTTRIASLSGEQLIFPNSKLTNSRVHNFKLMENRRIAFKFGVTYQTTQEKLKQIPGIVKGIIDTIENARFNRAHFFSYGDFSLIFEVVFYVLSPDYNVYMDIQQEINLRLNEEFSKQDIIFAYPTQTILLEGNIPKSN
jgi:small-conductance mechanosensitive channel